MVQIIDGEDLASYPGVTSPAEDLNALAERASELVAEAWNQVGVDPAADPPRWVQEIAINAALRVYWNPKGLISWTRGLDDGTRTERLPETAARAGLYLTTAEQARLNGRPARRRARFRTIRTLHGY